MEERIEIALLGQLDATVGGRSAALGSPLQRALLAALAVDVGRTVPVLDLIERLWRDDPPRTAVKSVQKYVSQLRAELGPAAIARVGEGYRLQVSPTSIDVRRIEAEVAGSIGVPSPGDRFRRLSDLVLRFSEPVLDGMHTDFAVAERLRVDEVRLTAIEVRLDAALELGRHRLVVSETSSLVAGHPFREELWRLLMVGLYRSGRQADAVRAFHRYRAWLASELGLEPGPELRELEIRILEHDDSLTVRAAPPVAADARSAAPPRRRIEERRFVTVVICDDGTRLAEVASSFGGRPGAIGGRPVAVFGFPAAEDDSIRAAAAARRLHDDGHEVSIESGVAELTDDGSTIELAGDIGVTPAPGRVGRSGPLIDAATADVLGDRALVEREGDRLVLVDVGPRRAPERAPLVGRESEQALITETWKRCIDSRGQHLLVVSGEGGVGKTRLLDEARRSLAPTASAWLDVACRGPSEGPFAPVTRLFGSAFGPDASTAIEVRLARSRLPTRELAWLRNHLAHLLDGGAETATGPAESVRAWSELLALAIDAGGAVIAVDDGHLASVPLRDLITELLTTVTDPLLIVVATRSDEVAPPWSPAADFASSVLPLQPLGADASVELAATLMSGDPLDDAPPVWPGSEIVVDLAERSGGNPYFLVELARSFREGGPQNDAPSTVRQALAARIDRVGDVARLTLQTAAVVAEPVSADALAQLAEMPLESVGRALAALRRRQLVVSAESGPSAHRIAHPLVAEVAAAQATPARALAIHRSMTALLLSSFDRDSLGVLERIAFHTSAAERIAVERQHPDLPELRRAAGLAASRLGERLHDIDMRRSFDMLLGASDRLDVGSAEWAHARSLAGQLGADLNEWEVGEELLLGAIDAFVALGDHRAEAAARVRLEMLRWHCGDDGDGEQGARALELVADDPGPELAAALACQVGRLVAAGRWHETLEVAGRHRDTVERHGTAETRTRFVCNVLFARLDAGDASALDELAAEAELAFRRNSTAIATVIQNNLGYYLWLYRGPDAAATVLSEAITVASDRNQANNSVYAELTLAEALADAGRWDEVIETARPWLHDEEGQLGLNAAYLVGLVELWRGGPAPSLSEDWIERARVCGDLQQTVPWLVIGALVAARDGDATAVRRRIGEMLELTHDDPRWRCDVVQTATRAMATVGAEELIAAAIPTEELAMTRPELNRRTALAVLALARGELRAAADAFGELVDAWSAFGNRLEVVLAARSRAAALAELGDPSAVDVSRLADERAAALGMRPDGTWWRPAVGVPDLRARTLQ